MIARCAIDPSAIDAGGTGPAARNQSSRLTRNILDFGVLSLGCEKDGQELTQAADRAQAELGIDFWNPLLRDLSMRGGIAYAEPQRDQSTHDCCVAGDLEALSGWADLAIIAGEPPRMPNLDDHLEEALYNLDGFAQVTEAFELTTPDGFDECETISKLRELRRETVIEALTTRDEIWANFFAPLARVSTEVNIFDRYFLSGLSFRPPRVDYLLWLLNSLDRDLPKKASINIYAYTGKKLAGDSKRPGAHDYRIDEIAEALRQLHKWNRPQQLNLYLAAKLDHDRHIRFSCGHAIMSQGGFDHLRFNADNRLTEEFSYAHVPPGPSLDKRAHKEEEAKGGGEHWVLKSKKGGFEEGPGRQ